MTRLDNKPVLFIGSPDFAIPSLNALIENGYNVTAVVTQDDKPAGRGYKMTPPAVKVFATEHNIPVFQPKTMKKADFLETLTAVNPSLIVVAAFGKILPPYIINYPEYGCLNVHGSLLPKYRGAAPMQRVIIDGEEKTGVTIMKMDKGLDTGDMLYKAETPISLEDNFETIHDRLADIGAKALITALEKLEKGELKAEKQDDALSNYAAKIENSDCVVDFSKDALTIHNQIRGLSPFPLAFATLKGKRVKLIASVITDEVADGECGEVVSVSGGIIKIKCGNGVIGITELLPEGKRRMKAADYINGRAIAKGDIFNK